MPITATDMKILTTVAETRAAIKAARESGKRIAFVPTMGALHAGHLSLVERAKSEGSCIVMSIFVNPLQFGPSEDLSKYPRPVEDDERLAEETGVDLLFRPALEEMYAPARTISVTAGRLGSDWEGKSRPGHFDGVLTVVAKLFNIVQPDVAIFGQKDLQQAALVSAMVRDLDMPIDIVIAPIVREDDGLALSSRNRYLSPEQRKAALALNRALTRVREKFEEGETRVAALENAGVSVVAPEPQVGLDYMGVVDSKTFERPTVAQKGNSIIIAARVGTTRLIDNMTL
jgi:pantoate--beta-alanine ligase